MPACLKFNYKSLPQHLLYLCPLPQIQGSLRPTFGESLVIGGLGGQQVVSLQQSSLFSSNELGVVFSFNYLTISFIKKIPLICLNPALIFPVSH